MKKTDPGNAFDCVKFKRRTQARVYEEIRHLTAEEELAYFRRAATSGPLGEWWKSLTHRRRIRRRIATRG